MTDGPGVAAYRMLLSPITINQVTIKNRIVSTAHATAYAIDGHPKEKYRRYYQRKARGGVGRSSPLAPRRSIRIRVSPSGTVAVWDDDIVSRQRRWPTSCIGTAPRSFVSSRTWAGEEHRSTHRARSSRRRQLSEPAHRERPKQMEIEEIRDVVRSWADAADRVKRGGYDGVEITSYGGHLLEQFWAPHVNKRTDNYGGSLENRMRLSVEVIEAVRDRVGSDFVVGFRMTGDQLLKGGLGHDEMKVIAARLGDAQARLLQHLRLDRRNG